MASPWYRRLFPDTVLSTVRSAAADFETTAGGGRLATSFGGAITGRGSDLIIIDDPIKPDEATGERARQAVNDYLASTLLSRFNDQNRGAILIVMQRLHEDDLCGHLLQHSQWRHLNLPAIAEEKEVWTYPTPFGLRTVVRQEGEALHPSRMSLGVLEGLRATMGAYHFAAQYQQRPAPFGGGLISLERFGRFRIEEPPGPFDTIVQSWDTANKAGELNDYSVCTTWGRKDRWIYLLAVDRVKMDYPKLRTQILRLRERDRPAFVLIEEGASGVQLLQELQQANLSGVKGCKPQKDKVMRLMEVSTQIDAGYVFLPREAPWLADYENEFANFPNGRHDDQVDSTTQALRWFMENDRRNGLFRFFAEEARARSLSVADEPRLRIIRTDIGISRVHGLGGELYTPGSDGVFELPTSLARNLLGQVGWKEVP